MFFFPSFLALYYDQTLILFLVNITIQEKEERYIGYVLMIPIEKEKDSTTENSSFVVFRILEQINCLITIIVSAYLMYLFLLFHLLLPW